MKTPTIALAVLSLAIALPASAGHAKKAAAPVPTRKLASNADFGAEKKFDCGGTEPFWSIKLTRKADKLVGEYSSPNDEAKTPLNFKTQPFNGMAEAFGAYLSDGTRSAVIVQDANCSDGMSDNAYAYEIFYNPGGAIFYGCCNVTKNNDGQ